MPSIVDASAWDMPDSAMIAASSESNCERTCRLTASSGLNPMDQTLAAPDQADTQPLAWPLLENYEYHHERNQQRKVLSQSSVIHNL